MILKSVTLTAFTVSMSFTLSGCQQQKALVPVPGITFESQKFTYSNYPIPGTSPVEYFSPAIYCANDPFLYVQTYLYGVFSFGDSSKGCITADSSVASLTHHPEHGGFFAAWNALKDKAGGTLDSVPRIRVAVLDSGFAPKGLIPPDMYGVMNYALAKDTTQDPKGPWNSGIAAGQDWTLTSRCPRDFTEKYGYVNPESSFGHLESVSAVIAAKINDGNGIAGAAPNIEIVPIRASSACGVAEEYANFPQDVLDKSTEPTKALIVARKERALKDVQGLVEAIRYAVDINSDVINISLSLQAMLWEPPLNPRERLNPVAWVPSREYPSGQPISDACVSSDPQFSYLQGLKSALDYAYDNNVPVVISGGNDRYESIFHAHALTTCGNAIIAISTNDRGLIRSDSRYAPRDWPMPGGSRSAFIAPVNIDGLLTYSWSDSTSTAPPKYSLSISGGTSVAAPLVTSMVAMAKQAAKLRRANMDVYNMHKILAFGYMPVAEESYERLASTVKTEICARAISRKPDPITHERQIVLTGSVFPDAHVTVGGMYCGYGPLHAGSIVKTALNPTINLSNVPHRVLFPWEGL